MIKLGPALAISTKLLSHPLVSAVATAAVGASLKQVLPLEDVQLLKETWDELSSGLKDKGARASSSHTLRALTLTLTLTLTTTLTLTLTSP